MLALAIFIRRAAFTGWSTADNKGWKLQTYSGRMASNVQAKLDAVPNVDIDDEGRFKYVLIKVYPEDNEDNYKHIVRGYKWADWHADVYDQVWERVKGLGLETECVGGGRIEHRPHNKTIKVYGYSQGYGKADHSITCSILKKSYGHYNSVTWEDAGY